MIKKPLGQIAYEAQKESIQKVTNINWIADWNDLSESIKQGWEEAAQAVRDELIVSIPLRECPHPNPILNDIGDKR